MNWVQQIQNIPLEKKYSQMGEESVIGHIFKNIGVTNKFYVDFGAWDGKFLSNTLLLKENGWDGLWMDGDNRGNKEVKQEFITKENINALFKKYKVPEEFDLLCIDIDGNDYWVWQEIQNSPRVVLIEYNGTIHADQSKTIKYNPKHTWGNNDYYGASFEALKKLGKAKGYSLVKELLSTNLFFVRNDIIGGYKDFGITYERKQYHPHQPMGEWVMI